MNPTISLSASLLLALHALSGPSDSVTSVTLPEVVRGAVLRRISWDKPGYRAVTEGGTGPGVLLTCPPLEEKKVTGPAARFSGRVKSPARVAVNGRPVKVYPLGSFVAVAPLQPGKNVIGISVEDGGGRTEYAVELVREGAAAEAAEFESFRHPRRGKTICPRAPLQVLPGGARILTLDEGTILKIAGQSETHFQVDLGGGLTGSVSKESVRLEGKAPGTPFPVGNVVMDHRRRQAVFTVPAQIPAWVEYISPTEFALVFCNAAVETEEINLGDWEGACRWEQEADGRAVFRFQGPLAFYRWSLDWPAGGCRLSWMGRPRGKTTARVLIDPGHGGEQAGAVSPSGLEEKEINLILGRELASRLAAAGVSAVISREADIPLELEGRVAAARQAGADLLVSIHFNSIAEFEDPSEKSGGAVYYYHHPSRELALRIYESLGRMGLKGNGVRWKSLAVLRSSELIAALVEVAYLTNPEDEARILNPGFIAEAANALAAGIIDYLEPKSGGIME